MNLEKLDEILALSPLIRYVAVVDYKSKILDSRTRENLEKKYEGAGSLHIDALIIRDMINVQEATLGKGYTILTSRENVHEFTLFAEDFFIYMTFDLTRLSDIAKIAEQVQQLSLEMIAKVEQ